GGRKTGNWKRETGNERETCSWQQAAGGGRRAELQLARRPEEAGNGKRETGNWERETGRSRLIRRLRPFLFSIPSPFPCEIARRSGPRRRFLRLLAAGPCTGRRAASRLLPPASCSISPDTVRRRRFPVPVRLSCASPGSRSTAPTTDASAP